MNKEKLQEKLNGNRGKNNLTDLDFRGENWNGFNFRRSYALEFGQSVPLDYGRNYRRANFSDCNLKNSSLFGCCLVSSNFSNADLSNADLHGCQLQDADLSTAKLDNADLMSAIYSDSTKFPDGFSPSGVKMIHERDFVAPVSYDSNGYRI